MRLEHSGDKMTDIVFISHYQSPLGGITLASNGDALTGLWFDGQKYFPQNLISEGKPADIPVFSQTKKWLDVYFSGREPDFTPPIFQRQTPFRNDVYGILLSIPYGHTVTYGDIAKIIADNKGVKHVSARAVGGAVGHNRIALIVPCHRVVGANGALTGYAGGIDKKTALLKLEKII